MSRRSEREQSGRRRAAEPASTPTTRTHGDDTPPDVDTGIDRRLLLASGLVAGIAGARLAVPLIPGASISAAGPTPIPAATVDVAADPVPQPAVVQPASTSVVRFLSPYEFGFVDGAEDATAPIQAMLDAVRDDPGARCVLPAGVLNVTNLRLDYADAVPQEESGQPFGFRGPKIEGASKRGTIIRQIPGTPGDVLTLQGKIDEAAGPANNNKVSGLSLSNLEIQGNNNGGNGIYVRSVVDSNFEEITITGCGRSGLYMAREAFVSGVYDEYSYGNRFSHLKLVTNNLWGVECSGTNSIAASFFDCESIGNLAGGYKLAPSGMILVHCLAIGNGVRSDDGRGILAVQNTNRLSTNNGLTLIGCRLEGNSTANGYEIEIETGYGHVITGAQFFATSGATPLGIGVRGTENDRLVRNLVVTGGFFGGDGSTGSQKIARIGNGAADTLFENLGFDPNQWAGGDTLLDLIDEQSGSLSAIGPAQVRFDIAGFSQMPVTEGDIPAPADGATFGVQRTAEGKRRLVVRFPSGPLEVLAQED